MNRDVCEHFNPVDLPCEKCKPASVQKSTLREAAQQALEAMETVELDIEWRAASPTHKMLSKAITALRAALAEPEDWELRRLREELERCKQTCAATSEAWREEAALAEPTVPSDCTDSHQPVAWYHVPHPGNGISPMVSLSQQREPSMYGAVVPLYLKEECYGKATNSEPLPVFTTLRQREWPALWTGCPNCASLEAQNTELDRKLAELEQTSLELCETCGWRTVIPAEGCLNCARSKPLTIERLRDALVASRIIPTAAVEDPDEYDDGVTLFRIEALHRRIT